jgi:hypothetical protein
LCMSLPNSDELVKQLSNQVREVCRAVFGRDPDLHSPDDSLIQYGNILINIGGRKGSWIAGFDPKTNKRQQGNDLLDLIQFRNRMTEPEALAWVWNKGLVSESPPPQPRNADAGEEKRDAQQIRSSGVITGTRDRPFTTWKSRWYEQVAVQSVQSMCLAMVLGIVGDNITGESFYSYEEFGRLMGKTGRTAFSQMKSLVKSGNVEIMEHGGLKGDLKKSNRYRPVLKSGQPKALDVLRGKKARIPKPRQKQSQCG